MSSVIIGGDTSGSVTLSAPAVSGSSVLTLPVATDTLVGKATTDTLTNKTLVSPTTSGLLAHTGRATISTNLSVSGNTSSNKSTVTSSLTVSGNTTISGLIANGAIGTSNYVLKTNGTTAFWGPSGGGVTTWSGGSTGLTPATATSGAVSLAGTLVVGNGGTGVATITTGGLVVGAATSAVTSLNPATAGNSIIDSGTAWTSVAQNWSYRNLLINGEMKVAQRGASFVAAAHNGYTLDNYIWVASGSGSGVVTITQSTTVPNSTFVNSLKIDVTTTDTSISSGEFYGLKINCEGLRCSRIGFGTSAAQSVTLSFWWRADSSDLTFPAIFTGSLINGAGDRSYPVTFTQTTNATWQRHRITITGDQSGTWLQTSGIGFSLFIALATGSSYAGTANAWAAAQYRGATGGVNGMNHANNDFYLTGLQAEVGSIATPFEYRSYGEELALCQRYLYQMTAAAGTEWFGLGYAYATTKARFIVPFPVPMRSKPTTTTTGTASDYRTTSSVGSTAGSAVPDNDTLFGSTNVVNDVLDLTVASGLVIGEGLGVASSASGGAGVFLRWSAEL